jgi:hypothetical protein
VLSALTSSALALPGLAGPARADLPVDRVTADYGYSYYAEDDLPSSQLAAGDPGRYEIQMHQFQAAAPLTERTDLSLDVVHETMSGATPWYVANDGSGNPVQVMTGATVDEKRTDALLTGSYYFERAKASLSSGFSLEKDYFALNGGLAGDLELNDKNTTLSGGVGLSFDRIEPTDSDLFPTRPDLEDKQSYSVFAGIAQVIRRNIAVQSTLGYQFATGYLSDPYKQVEVAGNSNNPDTRPGQRNQFAWLTRYRHHVSPLDGSLHADYQLALDDWGITSHTLELAWYQSLFDAVRLIPSFRYYSQSQADFYAPFFSAPARYMSSDYRLSPYGAISWKLRAEAELQDWPGRVDWRASFTWERYLSGGEYAITSVSVENPGLVSFNLFSLQLTGRF